MLCPKTYSPAVLSSYFEIWRWELRLFPTGNFDKEFAALTKFIQEVANGNPLPFPS